MKADQDKLAKLHNLVADNLIAALEREDGSPDPRFLAAAIKFLKDNGIDGLPTDPNNPLGKLASLVGKMPTFEPHEQR